MYFSLRVRAAFTIARAKPVCLSIHIEHYRAQELSLGRCYKIVWTILDTRKRLTCTFQATKREEMAALIANINSSQYTAHTRPNPFRY